MAEVRRGLRIFYIIMRYRLDLLFRDFGQHRLPRMVRVVLFFNPMRLFPAGKNSNAKRLRLSLEALGPVFIKFGQALSTRRDLLLPEFADELQLLQDQVPAFTQDPTALVEAALGHPLSSIFADFEPAPLASASVAQVHAAILPDGDAVVVKLIRPGIENVIRQDLSLMYSIAYLVEHLFPDGPRLHPRRIVSDYEQIILSELNLLHEAANTARLRRNFANSEMLYVPRVYWQHCRRNLLVIERIKGMPIGRFDDLRAAGTDMKVLAARGVEVFFTQVFQHNFFHADMHPGNIFVDISDPAQPSYIAVDCAIIGSLEPEHQRYLALNLLAFFRKDYRKVATLHLESGWVPPDTDVDAFEAVIREVCEPIFRQPLSKISFGSFVVQLFSAARQFKMEVQPELVLLQKTLLNIEGLGRQLYPELDLWEIGKPLLEKWLVAQRGPVALWQNLITRVPDLLEMLPELPEMLLDTPKRLNVLASGVRVHGQQLERLTQKANTQARRLVWQKWLNLTLVFMLGGLGYWLLWPVVSDLWQWLLVGIGAALLWLAISI